MKFTDFKRGFDNGECFPIYLFEGEDSFFADKGYAMIREKYLSEPQLNLACFDGESVNMGDFISSIEGFPFLSEKRITYITEFYPKTDIVKGLLKDFFDNPSPSGILVIANSKKHDPLNKIKTICVVECGKQDAITIARWIKAECSLRQVFIELETAKTLAEFCRSDMVRVKTETNKLCDFIGVNGTLKLDHIEQMVARDNEYKIYQMTDCIAKRQFDLAIEVITDMLSKGEPPQKILVSVYNYFRKLLHVAISDKTNRELGEILGYEEGYIRRMKTQSQSFTKRALKGAVDYLADADYKFKNGVAEDSDLMWISLFRIMTA